MFTGPVGPVVSFLYQVEADFRNLGWPAASVSLLASSPGTACIRDSPVCHGSIWEKGAFLPAGPPDSLPQGQLGTGAYCSPNEMRGAGATCQDRQTDQSLAQVIHHGLWYMIVELTDHHSFQT